MCKQVTLPRVSAERERERDKDGRLVPAPANDSKNVNVLNLYILLNFDFILAGYYLTDLFCCLLTSILCVTLASVAYRNCTSLAQPCPARMILFETLLRD